MGKCHIGLTTWQAMSEKQSKTECKQFLGPKMGVKEPHRGKWSPETQRPVWPAAQLDQSIPEGMSSRQPQTEGSTTTLFQKYLAVISNIEVVRSASYPQTKSRISQPRPLPTAAQPCIATNSSEILRSEVIPWHKQSPASAPKLPRNCLGQSASGIQNVFSPSLLLGPPHKECPGQPTDA